MAAEMARSSVYQFSFKMYFILSLVGCCGKSAVGRVTLSPMMVAPVCHVGDPLQITCTASVEFIRWSITVVNEQGIENEITVSRNSRDLSAPPRQRIINSTTFTFTRTSAQFASPLVSTLSINSTSIGLNGTVVRCINASSPMTSASTTIQIVDTSNNLYTPKVVIISEEFGADYVTVTVGWSRQVGAVYNTSILPLIPLIFTGSMSQLTIQYNTEYNLSMVAVSPCGNRSTTAAFIGLHYAKCGCPNLLPQGNNDFVPIIEGYDNIPVEGSTIMFSCPLGLVLTGSNSANCTGRGEWEPNPSEVVCTNVSEAFCGIPEAHNSVTYSNYNSTLEGSTITFRCTDVPYQDEEFTSVCLKNASWIPDPVRLCTSTTLRPVSEALSQDGKIAVASTIIVFIVTSILFFIFGFLCGLFYRRKRKTAENNVAKKQIPYYDDVVLKQNEQELELKENVAYGPVYTTVCTRVHK